MSRRLATTTAAADAAERNRATLKQLVKLESNKSCADCKRNKHPRWASWNLGVFFCIRCSGIHRGLGTHVSRVKSVDLDSWTDEQLANMIRWGNARANRYWEHKLAEGHVPNEAKIENFIRTKYEGKRWVMEGPMPDPATLDGGVEDEDLPLKVVQDRARSASQTLRGGGAAAVVPPAPRARPQDMDLFGDPLGVAPARPSTTEPAIVRAGRPKGPAAPPKQTRPGESLLGLDFFGGSQSTPPARPSSTGPTSSAAPGRTDLKQSILSLYATKPAPVPSQPTANASAFGGMQASTRSTSNSQALSGMDDAFGSLSFGASPTPQAKPAPFSGFTSPTGATRQPSTSKPTTMGGGSFFDAKPAPPPKQTAPAPRKSSFGNDFGDFSSAVPSPITTRQVSNSSMGALFDTGFSAPAPPPPPKPTSPPVIQTSAYTNNSHFNLTSPVATAPKPAPATSNFSGMDAWGSNDAWATPDPPAPVSRPAPAPVSTYKATPAPAPIVQQPMSFDAGWGDPEPASAPAPVAKVVSPSASSGGGFGSQQAQDDEFGGWSHASPVASSAPKQGGSGGGGSDDLFGNVWG